MPQQQRSRSSERRQHSSAQSGRPLSAGKDGSVVASLYCDGCDRHGHVLASCPHFAGRSRGSVPWLAEEHPDAVQPSRSEIAANIASGNIPDVLVDGIAIAMSGKGLMCWFRTMHHGLTALQHGKRPPTAAALQRDLAAFLLSAEARSVRNSACGELLGMVLQRDGSSLEQLAESTRRGGVAGMGGSDLAVAACHLYSVNYFVYVREGRRFRRLSSGVTLTFERLRLHI